MLDLKNITVAEYMELPTTIMYDILNHVSGENKFNGKKCNIMNLPYTNVKYCIFLLQKITNFKTICEVFTEVFGTTEYEFYNALILDFFKARNHIIETFKIITNNEFLISQGGNIDKGKWQMAGSDRLKPYDSVLTLDQLAQRYGGYPFDYGRKPYSEIFYLIAMTKTSNEVNYNYSTIK